MSRLALSLLLLTACAAPREQLVSDEARESREAGRRWRAWVAGYLAGMDEGLRIHRCKQSLDNRHPPDGGVP